MTELTNERAEFEAEANAARFFPRELDFTRTKSPSGRDEYANSHLQSRWEGWQAGRRATPSSECAPPRPAVQLNGINFYTAEQVKQIRREAVEADRRARSNSPEFDGIKAQPASAAQGVKTWQERCDWVSDEPATKLMVEAMKAEIADLRAQLAAATENLQTAVQQAWIANAELSKLRAQIARQSQDGERYRLVRAQLSRCDFNYFLLEGQLESDLDEYCDDELARGRAAPPLSSEPQERA